MAWIAAAILKRVGADILRGVCDGCWLVGEGVGVDCERGIVVEESGELELRIERWRGEWIR